MAELRTAAPFYWIFVGIFLPCTLLGVVVAVTVNSTFLFPVAVMAAITVVFVYWGRTTSLSVAKNNIRYRSLLVKKDVPLSEIANAEFIFASSGNKPLQRIVFHLRGKPKGTEIVINAGLFEGKKAKRWVDELNSRLA